MPNHFPQQGPPGLVGDNSLLNGDEDLQVGQFGFHRRAGGPPAVEELILGDLDRPIDPRDFFGPTGAIRDLARAQKAVESGHIGQAVFDLSMAGASFVPPLKALGIMGMAAIRNFPDAVSRTPRLRQIEEILDGDPTATPADIFSEVRARFPDVDEDMLKEEATAAVMNLRNAGAIARERPFVENVVERMGFDPQGLDLAKTSNKRLNTFTVEDFQEMDMLLATQRNLLREIDEIKQLDRFSQAKVLPAAEESLSSIEDALSLFREELDSIRLPE